MADIEPFEVNIADSALSSLKEKLALTTYPDELEGAGRDLGPPLADVRRLAAYWKDGFDWRAAEAKINKLPQFRTSVAVEGFDPLMMHFVWQKSSVPEAIPLLFVHGCTLGGSQSMEQKLTMCRAGKFS